MHPFYQAYHNDRKTIDHASPELRLMDALCAGDEAKAKSFFFEKLQFQNEAPFVDAPHGRYTGPEEIGKLATEWLPSFSADRAEILPVVQTKAGGRSVTEMVVTFYAQDEVKYEIPMLIVGDIRQEKYLDGARIYFHFQQAPGFSAYRPPIFKSQHLTLQEPHLLTGSPRAYFESIHRSPNIDVDRIMAIASDHCCYGGYITGQKIIRQCRADLREAYENMSKFIPRWLTIRAEVIIDDGISCVIEWVHVITKDGREEGNRLCESGVAVYERDADGYLANIRICDYAHCENLIDWSKEKITKEEAEKINYLG